MPADPIAVKALFLEAVALDDPAARAALLSARCPDSELLERVQALLDAHERTRAAAGTASAPGFEPTADPAATAAGSNPGTCSGAVVADRYALVELIGEGGMGAVWRAKQTDPVKRAVAVKLIKPGMDSRAVLARFEAERQALALMDHPHIAKVLDGGLHDGRPFFVMELVKGVPITRFCDDRKLPPRARLELFVQACQAIQHAHQKGVIHRDIKPSNVLVALYDDRPAIKVIDFGVAKAAGGALTERTIDTGFGVVGTPQYMSPEQATFNNLDIDTRSDVYALGVLLYELLVGSPPFSKRELEKKGLLEVLRAVREEEPPRPSTKLSTAEARPSISANRGTEPKALTRLLRTELDWIVMKALEKDRSRRYETANGFAADVLRYLSGEAVLAHPPSAAYRVRKFVRRHRPQMVAAALVFAVLVAGVIGTTVGLLQADRATAAERTAKDEAVEQKRLALEAVGEEQRAKQREAERADGEQKAKRLADKERQEAERNLGFAKKGNEILGSVFASLDPARIAESGRPLQDVLRENLARAVKELEGAPIGDPLEVAAMQNTLGLSLRSLGESALAADVFRAALTARESRLAPDHPDVLVVTNNLAAAYKDLGRFEDAAKLLEPALARSTVAFGPDHVITFIGAGTLAATYLDLGRLDKAVPLYKRAWETCRTRFGPDHPRSVEFMAGLAGAYQAGGQFDKALPLLEQALEKSRAKFGPDHPSTLTLTSKLAVAYQDLGQFVKAASLLERVVEKQKEQLGPDHPDVLLNINNLAVAYQNSDRLDKALPLLEQALEKGRTKFGPDHPATVTSMANLATAHVERGRPDLAVPLLEQTLEKRKARSGPDHPSTLVSACNLAEAYRASGRPQDAVPLLEAVLDKQKARIGPDHPAALSSANNLAMAYSGSGRRDKAVPLLEQTLEARKTKLGADHPDTLVSAYNLASTYQLIDRLDKALPLLEDALEKCAAALGQGHPLTIRTANNLAGALRTRGQFARAVTLFEQNLDRQKARLGADHPDTLATMYNLAAAYQSANRLDKAVTLLEETVDKQTAKLGRDNPATLLSANNLATAHLIGGRSEKAAPLFERVLAARRAALGADHPDTLFSMYNLASAYLRLNRLDEAVPLFEEVLARHTARPGSGGPVTLLCMNNLAATHLIRGRPDRAVPLFEQALELQKTRFGPDHPDTLNCMGNLGRAYATSGRGEQAARTLGAFADKMRKQVPKDSPPFAGLLAQVSLDLLGCGEYAAAEPLLRESLATREKAEPDTWTTFNTTSMLGGALLGQKKYSDAGPLLLKGYEGMKAREKSIPTAGGGELRVAEALDRLVELYTATNKPDEAKKYRDLRAKYPTPRAVAPPPREKK